jgi:DNA replicative helicase MCM subunit Mcm2 (Cdc46/Mcm family)
MWLRMAYCWTYCSFLLLALIFLGFGGAAEAAWISGQTAERVIMVSGVVLLISSVKARMYIAQARCPQCCDNIMSSYWDQYRCPKRCKRCGFDFHGEAPPGL